MGGCAIDATGNPLPDETLHACEQADAVLLGAVGGRSGRTRPRRSARSAASPPAPALDLFANLRPVKARILRWPNTLRCARIRCAAWTFCSCASRRAEFTSGRARSRAKATRVGHDALHGRAGAGWCASRLRRRETGAGASHRSTRRMCWRQCGSGGGLWTRSRVSTPTSRWSTLVDAAAMHLLRNPARFDVVLAGNMFGDILSDEASVLAGSPACCRPRRSARTFGVYEPIPRLRAGHRGQGIANPTGTILSAALLPRHSLGLTPRRARSSRRSRRRGGRRAHCGHCIRPKRCAEHRRVHRAGDRRAGGRSATVISTRQVRSCGAGNLPRRCVFARFRCAAAIRYNPIHPFTL